MSSGGGGPSGETRYNWNPVMEQYWGGNETHPGGLLGQAANVAAQPWQQYGGQRVAGFSNDQAEAQNYARNMARMSSSPIPAMDMARGSIVNTLTGRNLEGPNSNPFAGLGVPGNNPFVAGPGANEFIGQSTSTDRNAFAGNNPFFRDTMLQGMSDITDQYKNAIEPDLRGQMVLNGTLGGGAEDQLRAKNQGALAKNLTNFADSMLNQQYNRSASLEDAYLGRDVQNQQYNRSQDMGAREAQLGRGFQNYQAGTDRGLQAWENERNRQMQAIGQGQAEQGLAYGRIGALNDMGGQQQQNQQQNLDWLYQQFQDQQNFPYKQVNWLGSLLSQAQGGNPMNSQMYQGGGSQYAPWLGAALGAYSMMP